MGLAFREARADGVAEEGGFGSWVGGGATERKVSMQALVGNAEVEVSFKERDADKVLSVFLNIYDRWR